jgi:hypothetical protein
MVEIAQPRAVGFDAARIEQVRVPLATGVPLARWCGSIRMRMPFWYSLRRSRRNPKDDTSRGSQIWSAPQLFDCISRSSAVNNCAT